MFFSSQVSKVDVVETLRASDCIKDCAEQLRIEFKDYDFNLSTSYCDPEDVLMSYKYFKEQKPESGRDL